MADPVGDIPPPSALLLALEARGVFDIARLFAAAPFLAPPARRCSPRRSSCAATSSGSRRSAGRCRPAVRSSATIVSRANTARPTSPDCSATSKRWHHRARSSLIFELRARSARPSSWPPAWICAPVAIRPSPTPRVRFRRQSRGPSLGAGAESHGVGVAVSDDAPHSRIASSALAAKTHRTQATEGTVKANK